MGGIFMESVGWSNDQENKTKPGTKHQQWS